MSGDLFRVTQELERIPLPDSDIHYVSSIDLPKPADALVQEIIERVPWRSEEVTVWGKRHPQPRLSAWYGDPGRSYAYSGIRHEPLPWTETLLAIKERLERLTNATFNGALLNYYRNQHDSMGFHSDDEPELGPQPVIASLSLGAIRTFILKHRTRKDLKPTRIALDSGSLLVMRGLTQHYWKHGIDKQTQPCGPRVNLTFRHVMQRARQDKGGTEPVP